MDNQNHIATLGSLFDGIGGFPYAGSFFGIKPLWASEIMEQAISVTNRHLPEMAHVGDLTALNGGELPPVDIITFGSPCQDLSTAGKRAGMGGERSSLFYEAVRIIYEMREATNGRYPRYAVWENVPGALTSGKPPGSDFKAVLEAFAKTEIPIPKFGKWANAGMVRGNGVDLAWCVYNAQHFGVPQRRRRVFLICDFGSGCAGEILFVPKSLSGYFAARRAQGQGSAADAVRGADGASVSCDQIANIDDSGVGFDGYNGDLTGSQAATLGINCGMSTGRNGVIQPNCLTPWDTQQTRIFTDDGASPTLAGADGGGGRNPGGLVIASFNGNAGEKARSIGYSESVSPTLKAETHAPCLCEAKPVAPVAAFMGDSSPSSFGIEYMEEAAPTIKPRLSGTPCLCEAKYCTVINDQGGDSLNIEKSEISPTLRSETHGNLPIVSLCETYPINTQIATRHEALGEGTGFGIAKDGDPAYTLQETHSHAVAVGVRQCAGCSRNNAAVPSPDLLCVAHGQRDAKATVDLASTLTCIHEQPFICKAVSVHQGQGGEVNISPTAYTLTTCGTASARNAPLVCTDIHAFSLDSAESNSMKSSNPHSGCREVETARTLDSTNPCPSKNQGGIAVVETHPKVSGTLCASGAGLSRPAGMASETDLCIVVPDGEPIPIQDKATRCEGGGDTRNNDGAGNGLGVGKSGDPAPTITSGDRHAVAAYCLQGNMIGRQDHNGPRGNGVNEDMSFTLNTVDHHCIAATFNRQRSDMFQEGNVASTQTARQCKDATDLVCQKATAIDCRNFKESEEISGTLQAKTTPGYSLNYQNPVRVKYIVRRLLPVECERLQGYEDGWTEFTHDGKLISDTRRYQMLGNSVAVPCVAYILMGIAAEMRKEAETDGICTGTERPDKS